MQLIEYPSPLIVLVGPTAVGKTGLSIQLAKRVDAEIVSVDSRLFYRGMNIGTAKPDMQERDGVLHHMIDIADPDEILSLGIFQQKAMQVIQDIHARKRIPMLVGGTGQYVRAVIEGWQVPEQEPDPHLRQALEAWADQIGKNSIHEKLALIDPDAANKIDPSNLRRTIRALEVILGHDDFDADAAARYGWVNRALAPDVAAAFVERLARRVAALPLELISGAKSTVDAVAPDIGPGLTAEREAIVAAFAADDSTRRIAAFLAGGGQTVEGERHLGDLVGDL